MRDAAARAAAVAVHRFGLGEATLAVAGDDPRGWLDAQIGAADPQSGASALQALAVQADEQRRRRSGQAVDERALRELVQADIRGHLVAAATTARPFAERLALFWSNHFTVSVVKGGVRGLAGAFEREAIRPHIAGPFATLLKAAVTHPAMLRYLDNDRSAGPNSRIVALARRRAARASEPPRVTGLNENLAREVLELHTLGVGGGYTQADVGAFAAVLTGWRVPFAGAPREAPARFDPDWHEPGPKTLRGRRYPEGAAALDAVLHDLAVDRSTARFVATKLARHFVADDPPRELVAALEARWLATGGDLPSVYRALVDSPSAWAGAPAKLKSPEAWVVGCVRMLGLGASAFERAADGGTGLLGQPLQRAPSPAGWPDVGAEWLGPDALWKRVEWASRAARRLGAATDARALAQASFGPLLGSASARELDRAAGGAQALALLMLAPEAMRR